MALYARIVRSLPSEARRKNCVCGIHSSVVGHGEGRIGRLGIMKRFPVIAAWVMGFGLPLLETLRRRTDFGNVPAYVDDYIIGSILVWAAWAAGRGKRYGNGLLIAAWGGLCGGSYYSVMGQIMSQGNRDISGLPSEAVLAIKLTIAAVALVSLGLAIRRVSDDAARNE